MGFSMYLTGNKHYFGQRKRGALKGELYDLGYWQRHSDLHEFIFDNFADGVDDSQEIDLGAERIGEIIQALKQRKLPETTGNLSGASVANNARIARDVQIFEDALKWLITEEPFAWRSVIYQASS